MFGEEKIVGKWTINFLTKTIRLVGKLTVTDSAVYFQPTNVILGSMEKESRLFRESENGLFLRLAPQDILSVTAKSKILNKRIVMQIRDIEGYEQEIIFDNGALSLKSIIEALTGLMKVEVH